MALTMLIVDDSAVMRSVIIKTIKGSGYGRVAFLQAANGQEALRVLKENRVDLVITDFKMPLMNGMDLIAAMRADKGLKAIPCLVVTTDGSLKTKAKFSRAGATGYVQKPFTPEGMREKILGILGEVKNEEFDDSDDGFDF